MSEKAKIEASDREVFCSFCELSSHADKHTKFVAGKFGNICQNCVAICVDLFLTQIPEQEKAQ